MGHLSAIDMVAQTDQDTALRWHLQANHYPPIPAIMLPACKRAIKACNEGNYNKGVRLPADITYKGKRICPAWALAEHAHLDAFITNGEEY